MATRRKNAARKRGTAKRGRRSSGPASRRRCPDDAREVCRAFNRWARKMYLWANEVTNKIWPQGNPGPVNPPPKPPFAM